MFRLGAGWHGVERNGADWLSWSEGCGVLNVEASTNTFAKLSGQILSAQLPNTADVTVNDEKVTTSKVEWKEWAFHNFEPIQTHLKNTVEFVSHSLAIKLKSEARPLAIPVKNLALVPVSN